MNKAVDGNPAHQDSTVRETKVMYYWDTIPVSSISGSLSTDRPTMSFLTFKVNISKVRAASHF